MHERFHTFPLSAIVSRCRESPTSYITGQYNRDVSFQEPSEKPARNFVG